MVETTGDKNAKVMMFVNSDADTPSSYDDIPNKPEPEKWYKAHADELYSLKKNSTWRLVDRPKDRNVVGSRTIYRSKRDKTGRITRRLSLIHI